MIRRSWPSCLRNWSVNGAQLLWGCCCSGFRRYLRVLDTNPPQAERIYFTFLSQEKNIYLRLYIKYTLHVLLLQIICNSSYDKIYSFFKYEVILMMNTFSYYWSWFVISVSRITQKLHNRFPHRKIKSVISAHSVDLFFFFVCFWLKFLQSAPFKILGNDGGNPNFMVM